MIQVSQAELRAMARRAIDHRTRPLRVLALIAEGRTVREDICTALAARIMRRLRRERAKAFLEDVREALSARGGR